MDSDVFDVVKAQISQVLPQIDVTQLGAEDQLRDLGADSIDRAEIVQQAMRQLGLRLSAGEFRGVSNIGELVAVLATAKAGTV